MAGSLDFKDEFVTRVFTIKSKGNSFATRFVFRKIERSVNIEAEDFNALVFCISKLTGKSRRNSVASENSSILAIADSVLPPQFILAANYVLPCQNTRRREV
jgi:hypothetical protein